MSFSDKMVKAPLTSVWLASAVSKEEFWSFRVKEVHSCCSQRDERMLWVSDVGKNCRILNFKLQLL